MGRRRTLQPGEQSKITEKVLFEMAEEFMTKDTTKKKKPLSTIWWSDCGLSF